MAGDGLRTEAGADPDGLYQLLVEAHRDLTDEQSRLVNSKLILLLANHVGDPAVVAEAIAAAREGVVAPAEDP
ncbi:MAG TPA: DUF2783 domain-containing protein [Geminicoccaceae bacterium]|nr:DUF2783 domain-containing protein [Geminicoccaceae bacterium]